MADDYFDPGYDATRRNYARRAGYDTYSRRGPLYGTPTLTLSADGTPQLDASSAAELAQQLQESVQPQQTVVTGGGGSGGSGSGGLSSKSDSDTWWYVGAAVGTAAVLGIGAAIVVSSKPKRRR